MKNTFTHIYNKKSWFTANNTESISGDGSKIVYTENLRNKLPELVEKFSITSILDAPCGDFNWMKLVLPKLNVSYTGADIVSDIISSNNTNYSDQSTKFIELDITKDLLPTADLMICRDCLFHLSYQDIQNFINNFIKSDIKYLLTTCHRDDVVNHNIVTGGGRLINLFATPFNFSTDYLYKIDDWIEGYPERYMYLWSREQIIKVNS